MAECDQDGRRASLIRLALSLGDMSAGGLVAGGGPWPFHSDSSRAVPSPSPAVTPLRLPPCQGVNAMATASAEHRAVATGAGDRRWHRAASSAILCKHTHRHTHFHQLDYRRRPSASISSLNALDDIYKNITVTNRQNDAFLRVWTCSHFPREHKKHK